MAPRPEYQQQKLTEEIKAKQSNILWPDAMKNSSRVDEFLWKGDPNAPLVQRIGAWIFGLTFLSLALCFLDVAYERHDSLFPLMGLAFFALGIRVFLNGFRRSNGTTSEESSESDKTELSDKRQPENRDS